VVELGHNLVLVALAALTSGVGALGGIGGAVLLVPLLVVTGTPVTEAGPLGLVSVISASLAAASGHLRDGTVNHRAGVLSETAATSGAIAGALLVGIFSERMLTWSIAVVIVAAALMSGRRKGVRWHPDASLRESDVGEHVGSINGAYGFNGNVIPYRAKNVPFGVGLMGIAGFVTGLAGVGGGFIKTPITSEVMHLPVKVAAATSTFTIGLTASVALAVTAFRGSIDVNAAALVVLGAIAGGSIGSRIQNKVSPPVVRRALSFILIAVAVALVARS
jgi:uncharacterized membrane protein YfcA